MFTPQSAFIVAVVAIFFVAYVIIATLLESAKQEKRSELAQFLGHNDWIIQPMRSWMQSIDKICEGRSMLSSNTQRAQAPAYIYEMEKLSKERGRPEIMERLCEVYKEKVAYFFKSTANMGPECKGCFWLGCIEDDDIPTQDGRGNCRRCLDRTCKLEVEETFVSDSFSAEHLKHSAYVVLGNERGSANLFVMALMAVFAVVGIRFVNGSELLARMEMNVLFISFVAIPVVFGVAHFVARFLMEERKERGFYRSTLAEPKNWRG